MKRIVIITEGPFPYGMAATNRLVAYARGMVDAGAEVQVICSKPSEPPTGTPRNTETEGIYQGIRFWYSAGRTTRSRSASGRMRDYYSGFLKARKKLKELSAKAGVNVVFMGLSNHWFTRAYSRTAKSAGAAFVQERSEYPFIGVSSVRQRLKLWLYLRHTCRLFDAIIVITKALDTYYSRWIRPDASIFLLPMMVESDRFSDLNEKPAQLPEKYIAYVGSMQGNKDGVPILLEAFSMIAGSHPGTDLVMIGDTDFEGFDRLSRSVEEAGLSSRVHFTGVIGREELPAYLAFADYLALARPRSKQAEGGFPNKLGEYLATGKPVIATSVSEIPEYLEDGENAFVSEPDDVRAFADKLKQALDEPGLAREIGVKGKKLTETVFNPAYQATRMLEFFSGLKRSSR